MRALVCFKVTPDFEAFRESDWVAAARDGVETRYVPRVLNCFDEAALETALRFSDAQAARGQAVHLHALSVGGQEVEPFLATLRALGYERTARVAPGADLDFAPAVTAAIVVAYAQQIDHSELVLLGCRSGPGDGGTVPFRVAEALGWLCLTQVTEVEPLSDGRLRVAWVADDGLLRASLRLPCVLAIGNAIVSRLRVPTLSDRLTVRHRQSDVVSPADLGVDVTAALARECSALVGFEVVDRSRPGVVVGGRTPREKAQAVFDAYIRQLVQQT